MIVDCHYCEYATCTDVNSWCNCNVEDGCYFDHEVKDSKKKQKNVVGLSFATYFRNIRKDGASNE